MCPRSAAVRTPPPVSLRRRAGYSTTHRQYHRGPPMTMTAKTATLAGELPDLPLAACKGKDGDRFFSSVYLDQAIAKSLCWSCPEQQACLDWALTHDEWGVWGGTLREER